MSAAKDQLRMQLQALRAELSARDPDAGETLADKFPMKLLDRYGPMVSAYSPIGSEIDPFPLIRRLKNEGGADICLPRVEADGSMTFRAWAPGNPLEDRPFGLQEPPADTAIVTPTLVLTPLLGFDRQGNRLGYGKGHYDRTLSSLRENGRVFACGLGFHAQMLDELPAEPHDQPLDWAVT
ncbi:MAG: 5-formyltetrahydrofolate cyclo-ligase, partial [Pseudomonadota bacterium]|nr:5-formyltetrahydrofolate cyclo-ligase [Pseudomonadota bacterium]